MKRSMALGHCVCNPKQPCPCPTLLEKDLCPCSGERPDPQKDEIRLTKHVRKAGCGSKIGHADLERVLGALPSFDDPNVIIGVAAGDDAGVYRIDTDRHIVQTVDVFSPVVDDAYTFGRIAAANSLSDVYAMAARPLCALSIIGFPIEELPREVMADILRGGVETMHEAGVSVIGGHSINDEEIKFGFAVTGLASPGGIMTNSGARTGDHLVLTKPVGTGIVAFAAQIGMASQDSVELISRSMATLNRDAAELMTRFGSHASTDVTGFSLAGHAIEMARRSGVTVRIDLASVPVFAEALGCLRREIIPGSTLRNRESFGDGLSVAGGGDEALLDLLYDAQTSGGLLVSLPADGSDAYVRAMRDRGHEYTSRIGTVSAKEDSPLVVALGKPSVLVGTYREPETAEAGVQSASLKRAPAGASRLDSPCCGSAASEVPVSGSPRGEGPPETAPCCEQAGDSPGLEKPGSDAPATLPKPIAPGAETPSQRGMKMKNADQSAEAFRTLMGVTGRPGAVDARTKRLVAVALSICQRCEPCFRTHVLKALEEGITREEIDEVAWVATSFTGCTGRMFYEETMKEITKS